MGKELWVDGILPRLGCHRDEGGGKGRESSMS